MVDETSDEGSAAEQVGVRGWLPLAERFWPRRASTSIAETSLAVYQELLEADLD